MCECSKEIKEARGWAKMLHFLRDQEGEIHPFHGLAVSLPALGHDLGKGSWEVELTISLPFIFGRDWSGIKVKISLLHDEISPFFWLCLSQTCLQFSPKGWSSRSSQREAMLLMSDGVRVAQNQAGNVENCKERNNFLLNITGVKVEGDKCNFSMDWFHARGWCWSTWVGNSCWDSPARLGCREKPFPPLGSSMDHMLQMEAVWVHYSLQNYGRLSSLQPWCQSETEKAFGQREVVLQKWALPIKNWNCEYWIKTPMLFLSSQVGKRRHGVKFHKLGDVIPKNNILLCSTLWQTKPRAHLLLQGCKFQTKWSFVWSSKWRWLVKLGVF